MIVGCRDHARLWSSLEALEHVLNDFHYELGRVLGEIRDGL